MERLVLIVLAFGLVTTPLALGGGIAPVNPVINGDFDTDVPFTPPQELAVLGDVCVGVGHQALDVADDAPTGDPNALAAYAVDHATMIADDPEYLTYCQIHNDVADVNAWRKLSSGAPTWSRDSGVEIVDADGDGDREAVIPTRAVDFNHDLWQSWASPQQAWSLDFDAFAFTVESGAIPSSANNQIGFSLTPSYAQHPYVGIFWEGAVHFTSADMRPDANGRVTMDPVRDGSIICPSGYTPCLEFRAAYAAADDAGKHTLLGQARIVQTSFWAFNNLAGPVAIDDIAFEGAKLAVETAPHVDA